MKNTIYLARALPSAQNRSQISLPLPIWQRGYRGFTPPLEAIRHKEQRAAVGAYRCSSPSRPERCHNLPSLISNTQTSLTPLPPPPHPRSPPILPLPSPPRCCSVLTAGASRSHISGNFLKCHSSLSDWMAPGSNAAHADTLFSPRPVCPVPTRLLSPPLRRRTAKSLRPCMFLSFCLFFSFPPNPSVPCLLQPSRTWSSVCHGDLAGGRNEKAIGQRGYVNSAGSGTASVYDFKGQCGIK